ncbi:NAD(P)/FAD-dependent oxidoreductase [Amaricoccus solimangrovi]|uniref:NAD(P)/FAD-dependent oxidoreductase n=1 Tax=Amaricoccus solimangrovi TaxID=2589815 RepID=A0A501WMC2_9RHOB|nr:NAD(P)/FAD-dependent oxidoreductase [Amaricoccus solimangrovi]TPE48407.1 NAD(P)/FAD-dependent oxidoreductase [Amaricoccus solimangrovi]
MERTDCIVVGAGVVGLAAARAIARAGREVILLEAEERLGCHTSARNSEVIHAGIYYPAGSAKAEFCVRGREMLYAYAAARGIAHARTGKIIVATGEDQVARLDAIAAAAAANGVADLLALDRAGLARLEPALRGVTGLLSPSTGIIDGHGLMLSLQGEIEDAGGAIALRSRFRAARPLGGGGFAVTVESGGETVTLAADRLVNAAGLFAGEVAAAIEGLAPAHRRRIHYCKGSYFAASARVPFRHLIYPVPERDGLGVHLTLDLAGQGRFGPDTEWVETIDYSLDPRRGAGFAAAIRSYWPGLPEGALAPTYAGIRPKLAGPGGAATDFRVEGPETHGLEGLVNLFGIESPGLTSSLALGEAVRDRLAA